MSVKSILISIFLISSFSIFGQQVTVIESTSQSLTVSIDFRNTYSFVDTVIEDRTFQRIVAPGEYVRNSGEPLLPHHYMPVGIPPQSSPTVKVLSSKTEQFPNMMIMPTPGIGIEANLPLMDYIDQEIYYTNAFFPKTGLETLNPATLRYATILPVIVYPFRYNPVTKELIFTQTVTLKIAFGNRGNIPASYQPVRDEMTENFLRSSVINYDQALNWMAKERFTVNSPQDLWYDPAKTYFKIYLNEKGVYKITFEELVNAGVPLGSGVNSDHLAMFHMDSEIPIEVNDGGDGTFSSGDFIAFVGDKAPPSEHSYLNIYNNTNVYFFTHEQTEGGKHYVVNDAFPVNYTATHGIYTRIDHYEEDHMYEHLGYAPNGERDHWFWDKATMTGGSVKNVFRKIWTGLHNFVYETPVVTARVDMHGLTTSNSFCTTGFMHSVDIMINNIYKIGNAKWSGQNKHTWEGTFYVGPDSVVTVGGINFLSVIPDGDICLVQLDDDVRVNWFEFEYNSWMRVPTNEQFDFKTNNSQNGIVRFWLFNWYPDSMRVFVPSTGELLLNAEITHDYQNNAFFMDTVAVPTEYFLVGENNYYSIDSMEIDKSSDLRNVANGADYIIITHPSLMSVAQRLANFRQNNFPDTSIPNPRIEVVDVDDIYDQFSGGLLNPYAIRDFLKYAYEWWVQPAPLYVALIGDMSYDYRGVLNNSRPSLIPSIPYHSTVFGEAPSDNGFVAISGDDVLPEMVIGRVSIETVQEGNDYLYKVENYPSDPSKGWKENILLLASGLNEQDERQLGFNDESLKLDSFYLKPNGYNSTKIFRYPSKDSHFPFVGSTPDIRQAFDQGAVLCNYYGHGGGYQWDLTFLNDDIYLLNNEGRLPLVVSVTCYTAHFSNQNVFGEQFIKIPEKGAIGFFGSAGLTHWQIGTYFNGLFFSQIFNQKNYVSGKAVFNAKGNMPGFSFYGNQVALLTYLGEPLVKLALPSEPDFSIRAEDISITPNNALIGDSLQIKFYMNNYGILVNDSVKVKLSFQTPDSSGVIIDTLIPVFGNRDSLTLKWIPQVDGLVDITVDINKDEPIPEADLTDNTAKKQVVIYNISEPAIVAPVDGFTTTDNRVTFTFADIGHYIDLELEYYIEIDTSLTFDSPWFQSGKQYALNGVLSFQSPELQPDKGYYWRARIFDGNKYGRWSEPRTMRVMSSSKEGYFLTADQLKTLYMESVVYNEQNEALSLDIALQMPKPSKEFAIDSINLSQVPMDDTLMSCIATDGKYYYVGNKWYYALNNNFLGKSKIYRIGSGHQGTVKGQSYGEVPNFFEPIRFQLCYHSDGYLYVPTKNPNNIIKVDPETGDTTRVFVEAGLLEYLQGKVTEGDFYLASDSQYVYNLSFVDTTGEYRYTMRIFDPSDNWRLVNEIYYPNITSYLGLTGFFVLDGYFYVYENYYSGFMRRIRIADGFIDQEWITYLGRLRFHAWAYDWKNDEVVATQFWPGSTLDREIWQFEGYYIAARGEVLSNQIGPVRKWNTLNYEIDQNQSEGNFHVILEGYDRQVRKWDTLSVNTPTNFDLRQFDPRLYHWMRIRIALEDSSQNSINPIEIKNFGIEYEKLPELHISRDLFSFQPDSVLQGLNISFQSGTRNIGFSDIDSAKITFYLNNTDSVFYSETFAIEHDSTKFCGKEFNTAPFILGNRLSAIVETPEYELFTFNNAVYDSFYIARDSIDPSFKITFDGEEILDGDIISETPDILITLQDNSPLPLDTNYFTLLFDNVPLNFNRPDVQYTYSPYPNSEAQILWQPELESGRHTLDVLAKDASNNFFDTTYNRSIFYVFTEEDIVNFYNYPNPFEDDTYFTYELHGSTPPEELRIKIFTVAGRLIREMTVPHSNHTIGYNNFYWDGRDQDGDEIANGVYFYKVIVKYPEETKTFIDKIVKMK